MSKKSLRWLLIFSIIINISTIATFSYYRWLKAEKRTYSRKRSSHRESFYKKLGLSEEQSEKVKQLRSDLWDEIKPLRAQLNEERRRFVQTLKKDTINIDEVYEKVAKIAEIQKAMQLKTVENMLAHQSILTAEQRKLFFSMMTRRMQLAESRHKSSSKSRSKETQPAKPGINKPAERPEKKF